MLQLAREAGMPPGVLRAYFSYIDNISVWYQVADTIGAAHYEKCSIPQGCPLSMAMVALLTRVWVLHTAKLNVEPRCLADDLLLLRPAPGTELEQLKR